MTMVKQPVAVVAHEPPKTLSSEALIKKIVQLDSTHRTWKQKLEVVAQIVDEEKSCSNFSSEGLSLLAAYLYFINSGQIVCAENGTHFRPNHNAELSYGLYQTLDNELSTDTNAFIVRSLKKNLPSFADSFTASVPLTRIRDIAHRNDIPQDLKTQIKTRLQNKLHRCCDPGDLKTCEELITRARQGSYSPAFVQEFEIFYEELKEFFNATGLEKRLESLGSLPMSDQIGQLLKGKRNGNKVSI